jgi:hydrogenase nickel incorporation protein HypA/HybF
MHELSIVMSIVQIATKEASRNGASIVDEIELDIGVLSGVEMDSFDFAWQQGVKHTVLQQAVRHVNRIPGRGSCLDCATEFPMQQLYDACPACDSQLVNILSGRELSVKTLLVPDTAS